MIEKYGKIFFGNILAVDFVEKSNAVDQVIALNYNYNSCRDTNWGDGTTDCPELTDLSRAYKYSDISAACLVDSSLNSTCARSCGYCEWITGVPGGNCTTDSDCDSGIYAATLGTDGTCMTDTTVLDFTGEEAFCLAPYASEDCGTIGSDECSDDVSTLDGCDGYCAEDFQCEGGYCNTATGLCLTVTTPAPSPEPEDNQCYCPQVTSDEAIEFRDQIEWLRPGEPDGEYSFTFSECQSLSECNDVLDENPYVKSVVGFIVVPLIASIVMILGYCCCSCAWVCCQHGSKRKCCCCIGDPEDSLCARWCPSIFLVLLLCGVVWACIQGIMANSAMHDHIFSDEESSVSSEILELCDTVITKFEGVGPDTQFVVDNAVAILDS